MDWRTLQGAEPRRVITDELLNWDAAIASERARIEFSKLGASTVSVQVLFNPTVQIGDTATVTLERGEVVRGYVVYVEQLIKSGQAITRVDLLVARAT